MAERNLGTMTEDGKAKWSSFKQETQARDAVHTRQTLGRPLELELILRRTPGALRRLVVPSGASMTAFFLITQTKTGSSKKTAKLRGQVWTEAMFEWPGHTLSVKSDGTLWMSGDDSPLVVVVQ
jgi:hypothetical protein